MFAKLLTVFIVYLYGVYAQPGQGECPHCSNPHDPASCTGRQNCHAHSCELRLYRFDRNRVEFACAHGQECNNQDTRDCSHILEPCATCCHSYDACLQVLTNLLADTHSTQPPPTTRPTTTSYVTHPVSTTAEELTSTADTHSSQTPTTESPTTTSYVTHPDSTTAEELTSTAGTNHSLATPTEEQTTTEDVTHDNTTTPPVWNTTPVSEDQTSVSTDFVNSTASDAPTTAQTRQSCVQCGDFAFDKPCTPIELLLNDASSCPEGLPYCFESVSINGGSLQVVRGCAEANFCRVEWDIGHSQPGCYPLDVSTANVSCTYCCSGDSCNNITPPSEDSLLPFT